MRYHCPKCDAAFDLDEHPGTELILCPHCNQRSWNAEPVVRTASLPATRSATGFLVWIALGIGAIGGTVLGVVVGLVLAVVVAEQVMPKNSRVSPPMSDILLIVSLPVCIGPTVGLFVGALLATGLASIIRALIPRANGG